MEDSTRHAGVDLDRYGDAWEAWRTIVHALLHLDPFMDVEEIDRFEPLQDEIDLDAVRWRSFITEVAGGCGLEIPEVDEPDVLTLDGLEQYLTRHAPMASGAVRQQDRTP